jgi:hypothetical protein
MGTFFVAGHHSDCVRRWFNELNAIYSKIHWLKNDGTTNLSCAREWARNSIILGIIHPYGSADKTTER